MTDQTVERWDWDDTDDLMQLSELGPYVLYEDHAHAVADARREALEEANRAVVKLAHPVRDGMSGTQLTDAQDEALHAASLAIRALQDADTEGK